MRARLALLALLSCLCIPAAMGLDLRILRDPRAEVEERLDARLEADQAQLVDFVMTFYAVKYGRAAGEDGESLQKAVRAMSSAEYDHATEKAALVATSKTARALLKLGKYGEKALKALVVVAEDAAKDLDRYITEKSIVFDERH